MSKKFGLHIDMTTHIELLKSQLRLFMLAVLLAGLGFSPAARALEHATVSEVSERLQVGDIIFVRIPILPFKKIASDTGSWTNHVGIITGKENGEFIVSESTFPFSRATRLPRFIARSEGSRVAIKRLNITLTAEAQQKINSAARNRYGIWYDTGFDLHSNGQFCSRYVHEVLKEAMGIHIGKITTLSNLFKHNPNADIAFWRAWYLGSIPWDRETITPASILLDSHQLHDIFDGYADRKERS